MVRGQTEHFSARTLAERRSGDAGSATIIAISAGSWRIPSAKAGSKSVLLMRSNCGACSGSGLGAANGFVPYGASSRSRIRSAIPRASAVTSLVRTMTVARRSGTRTKAARLPSGVAQAEKRRTPWNESIAQPFA